MDTAKFPHDEQRDFMQAIDESVARKAAESIQKDAPNLSWVYLEYTDDMGHKYGDSPQYNRSVTLADQKVGYIWDAIQYRQKKWLLIVTTDHGRDAKTGKGHGGQSKRERSSWIFTNARDRNAAFRAPQASIVDIMPTIARFLDVTLPTPTQREVDGVPFLGKISALSPDAHAENGKLRVRWKAVDKKGTMKIWLSTTNQAKTGGTDDYRMVAEVPVGQEQATIDLGTQPVEFAKIVLEAPYNTLNRWIVTRP